MAWYRAAQGQYVEVCQTKLGPLIYFCFRKETLSETLAFVPALSEACAGRPVGEKLDTGSAGLSVFSRLSRNQSTPGRSCRRALRDNSTHI